MLSGRRPGYLGVYDVNHDFKQAYEDRSIVTITQQFMANGYDVHGAGKIYHPMSSSSSLYNADSTWNTYTTGTAIGGEDSGGNNVSGLDAGSFDWGTPTSSDADSKMLDYQNATTTINSINAAHTKPFFIAVGFAKPHVPWYVPAKYFNKFTSNNSLRPAIVANDLSDVPAPGVVLAHRNDYHSEVTTANLWNNAVQGYLAAINFVDTQVGRVLNALNASPYKDNTIVVLVGDHGFDHGEKEHWHKTTLWETVTRVPLVFSGPTIAVGGRSSRPVDLMSVYPTLTALTGVPTPSSGFDGVSIVPLLTNPAATAPSPVAISTYWDGVQTSAGKAVHTARTAGYRYIKYADGSEELYDEVNDPHEWINQAANPSYAAAKTTMAGYLPTGVANNRPPIACFPGAGACGGLSLLGVDIGND
jgi:arylsulfatase A-like enzyme